MLSLAAETRERRAEGRVSSFALRRLQAGDYAWDRDLLRSDRHLRKIEDGPSPPIYADKHRHRHATIHGTVAIRTRRPSQHLPPALNAALPDRGWNRLVHL